MQIETWPIDRLKPYANNPRLNDDAVDAVARSIQEFGFRQPIVVDEEGVIIIGHTRLKAAQRLGLTEVPVHVARGLSPDKVKALRIADNKTAELAEWNLELLPIELAELKSMDFDLDVLGFDQDELAQLLDPGVQEGLCDPDEIPAPPDEAITQPGDLWLLGDHRLLCGDSSLLAHVEQLLDGHAIQLVNTDPPYNVNVEPRSRNAIAAGLSSFPGEDNGARGKRAKGKLRAKDRPLANDAGSAADYGSLLDVWFGNLAHALVPGRAFYIWGGFSNLANYPPALKAAGLYFSQTIIWDKQHPVINRKDFMAAHEWCYYGWKEGAAHEFFGPNNATDLWHVKKVNPQAMVHLTEKPVELAARAMQYSTRSGENVLDLFGGSGSTMIAAQQTGRRAFLMELDPLYCDVIVQRYEEFTGQKAERKAAMLSTVA